MAATRWGLVWLFVAAGLAAAAHVGKVPPALPAVRADLDLSLVLGGWVVASFSVTGMLCGMVAGAVADRVGHLRLMQVGLAGLAVAATLGALSPAGPMLLATRFAEGFFLLSVTVSAPVLIGAATALADRRLALGVWGGFMPAGMAAMMLLAPPILAGAGWRALWVATAAIALFWLWALRLGTRKFQPPRPATPQGVWRNLRLTAARLGPWLIALCFAFYTLQWVTLMVWLPTFLIEERGMETAGAAAITALVTVVNVVGNLAAGWLLRAGAARWVLLAIAGLAMGGAMAGIFSAALSDGIRLALCIAFSALGGMLPTSLIAAVPVFAPSPAQVGTGNGLLIQGAALGQIVGPPAVAAVVSATGQWESASLLMLAAAAGIVALAFVLGRLERRALAAL